MERLEFIQTYLSVKGVHSRLTKPYPLLLSKFYKKHNKPRLFESPVKLFFLQSILGAVSWGGFMWLFIWQFQEFSAKQFYASVFFGIFTGLLLAVEVAYQQKKHGIKNWNQWLKEHELSELPYKQSR